MKVHVTEIYAWSQDELEKKLNELEASHIVSVIPKHDGRYEVIYQTT